MFWCLRGQRPTSLPDVLRLAGVRLASCTGVQSGAVRLCGDIFKHLDGEAELQVFPCPFPELRLQSELVSVPVQQLTHVVYPQYSEPSMISKQPTVLSVKQSVLEPSTNVDLLPCVYTWPLQLLNQTPTSFE